jgi:hypothetical protein
MQREKQAWLLPQSYRTDSVDCRGPGQEPMLLGKGAGKGAGKKHTMERRRETCS